MCFRVDQACNALRAPRKLYPILYVMFRIDVQDIQTLDYRDVSLKSIHLLVLGIISKNQVNRMITS